ncbi:MAG: hypothetical protein ACYCR4_06370 [Acidimicrobiales bacterium]
MLPRIAGIAVGAGQILAWTPPRVYCWGRSDNGASARGYGHVPVVTPTRVPGISGVKTSAVDEGFPVIGLTAAHGILRAAACAWRRTSSAMQSRV